MKQEILKYLRQFRWYIGAYVLWLVFTTYLTSTHQAFVHSSAAVRQFAWVVEGYAPYVSLLILLPLTFLLWMADCLWDRQASWQLRPRRPGAMLAAKTFLLVVLALVLPFLASFFSSLSAGVGMANAVIASLDHALWVGFLACFVCLLALLSENWLELGALGVLGLVGCVTHLIWWWFAMMGGVANAGRLYTMAGCALAFYAIWRVACLRDRGKLAHLIIVAHLFALLLGVVMFFWWPILTSGPKYSKDAPRTVYLFNEEAYHVADGLKICVETSVLGAAELRYWYQGDLRSKDYIVRGSDVVYSLQEKESTTSVFPWGRRLRLETPLPGWSNSGKVVASIQRKGDITEHRIHYDHDSR